MVQKGLLLPRVLASAALVWVAAAALPAGRASEVPSVAGTMPEDHLPELKPLLAHALLRSPEQIARTFERTIQEARLTMARAARLPNVGGNFDYGLTESASTNNSAKSRSTGAQYSFNAGQALFHWGAIRSEIEMARLNLAAGDKETARIHREVGAALRKAYLALVVEKARVLGAQDAVALVEADVRVAQARKEDGTISGAVLAGEELRLRDARLQLARVQTEFGANRARFARAAGLPQPLAESAIPDDIPRLQPRVELGTALAAHTLRENARSTLEWEIYDLRLREAEERRKVVGTRLLPKFGLGGGYSLRTNTYVNGPTVNQESVTETRIAVTGGWTIFDGFATGGAKREALASKRALEHRKTVEIDQLLQTVQQLERSLKNDVEALELADIRLGIARQGQEIMTETVALGTLPKAELQRGEANIRFARAAALEARAVYLGRWSDLVAATGRDPATRILSERHGRTTN